MAQPRDSHPVLGMRQRKVQGGPERWQSPEVEVGGGRWEQEPNFGSQRREFANSGRALEVYGFR